MKENNLRSWKKLRLLPLMFLLAFYIILVIRSSTNNQSELLDVSVDKVVVGTVSCRKDNDTTSNEEVVVLIKSVLISAFINNVANVEFHLFLEHLDDTEYFANAAEEMGYPGKTQPNLSINFYSVLDAIPEKYHNKMIFDAKAFRCGHARLFFSKGLPDHVDSILYLDTDYIVTGNIAEFWYQLERMNEEQLIGVVPNYEPEVEVSYPTLDCFGRKPHFPKTGLNSGLQLMNLTRMRAYNWEEKLIHLYDLYLNRFGLDDQMLLNVAIYHDPGLLRLLPCEFNVRCSPCEMWFLCKSAREYGIQGIHGAFNQFTPGARFYFIYDKYHNFNMKTQDIIGDLMYPLSAESDLTTVTKLEPKCAKPVNRILFLNLSKALQFNFDK